VFSQLAHCENKGSAVRAQSNKILGYLEQNYMF
jgi:hypothetical protein